MKRAFRFSSSRIEPGRRSDDVYALRALLGRYGYLAGHYQPGFYDERIRQAVSRFQSFYGLDPDEEGVCDEETTSLLIQPRCEVPDHSPIHRSVTGRLSPFVTVGAKWPRVHLAYRFLNSTPDLPVDRQREIIRQAFSRWAEVSSLEFEEVPPESLTDLSIGFYRGSHGDGAPFDNAGGPDGNTLAHAFFPPPAGGEWAGSLHFDEFERWSDSSGEGVHLFPVSLHEIGHLLGLAHSQDRRAIMYAYYSPDRTDLSADDIAGIQSVYGSPASGPVTLFPGQEIRGYLPSTGSGVHYQMTLHNKLLIRLEGPSGQDFDLYVRYGAPAGTKDGEYDFASYGLTSNEVITIPSPRAGTYYILVQSYQGSGSYTIEGEVV